MSNKIIKLEQTLVSRNNLIIQMNHKLNEFIFKIQQLTLNDKINSDKIEKLTEENDKLKENLICSICYTNTKSVILNPCFHFNLCQECVLKIDKCPICRDEIECYHIVF